MAFSDLLQFLISGVTRGSIYGMVGIGYAMIFRSSHVINFAQGEFVMVGGMVTVFLVSAGLPLLVSAALAILSATIVGALVQYMVIGSIRSPSLLSAIIVTIGISMILRGLAEALFGRQFYSFPGVGGQEALDLLGARVQPQSLLILIVLVGLSLLLWLLLHRTLVGKGIQAAFANRLAATLCGIDIPRVLIGCFAVSGAVGAMAGILTTPITLTQYDIGLGLGLKGFCASVLGGLTNPFGAVFGGLILGLIEALAGGYLSSAYQDAVAFLLIIAALLLFPHGLFVRKKAHRV